MRQKRFWLAIVVSAFLSARLFPYNPPVGGENLFRYGHADLTSQAASAAGGALFGAGPQSVVINPALVAGVQRVSVDLGYTGLFPAEDAVIKLGTGLQLGALFPTRWGVAAATVHGLFVPTESMKLGNSLLARAGFSRDVTDKLYVGVSAFAGVNGGEGTDWAAGLDIGFWWRLGTLGPLSDFRIGGALLNMGKTFIIDVGGIKTTSAADHFPGIFTPRAGVAAKFLDLEKIEAGFSADLSLPFFQNAVLDAGAQIRFADIVTVSAGWQFNIAETAANRIALFPSIGLSVKFKWNSSKSEFMSSKGWDTSDVTVSGNWRQIYSGVQQVSAGVTANFGLPDTDGPAVSLWGD
jgi:hypothetical protein